MRIILTTLLLALCLSACVPAEPSSSAPESEPEVTSGLEVQFDDPAEPPRHYRHPGQHRHSLGNAPRTLERFDPVRHRSGHRPHQNALC